MAGVLNKRTLTAGKKPTAALVAYGEICVNYSSDTPMLCIKDKNNLIRSIPLDGLIWREFSAGNYATALMVEDLSSNTGDFQQLTIEGLLYADSIMGRNNQPIAIINPELQGDTIIYPNLFLGNNALYGNNVTRISLNESNKSYSEFSMYVTKAEDTSITSNLFLKVTGEYGAELYDHNVLIDNNRVLFFTDGTNDLKKLITNIGNTNTFGAFGYYSNTINNILEFYLMIGSGSSKFSFRRANANFISTNGIIIPSSTSEVAYIDVNGRSVLQQVKSKEKMYCSGLEIGSWTNTNNKNLLNFGWLGSTTYTELVIQGKTSTASAAYNVNFMKFMANSTSGTLQLLAKTELRNITIAYADLAIGGRTSVETITSDASVLFMSGSVLEFAENWSDTSISGYGCEMGFNNNNLEFYSIIGYDTLAFVFGQFNNSIDVHSASEYDGLAIALLLVIRNTGIVEARLFKTVTSSDSTIKENIRVKDCVSLFKSFGNYYTFDFTEEARKKSTMLDKSGEGFIAQNIQKVMPEAVELNSNNWLAIDYFKIYNVGMGALKQLIDRVEELEQQILELKQK